MSEEGILRAGCDQGVHVALQRAHTDRRDGCAGEHERNGSQITRDHHSQTPDGAQGVAHEIELVHASEFRDQSRGEQESDDHRNIDRPGENAQEVGIFQHIGHVVDSHVQGRCIDLHENIGRADHQVIFVLDQQLEGIDQGIFLLGICLFLNFLTFRKLFRGKLSDRHYGECVGDNAYDGVDDRHCAPRCRAAAEVGHQSDRDGLDQHAGAESKHKADGTHLDTLMVVFGDQGCQGGVGNVVGCVKSGIQKCVGDKEPGILDRGTGSCGNAEDRHKTDCAAEISVEHPRTGFSHPGVGLVN